MQDDETMNRAVQEFQTAVGWEHREDDRELYAWFSLFNARFFDGLLPQAVIAVERLRQDCLGSYCAVRNSLGLLHQIRINERLLAKPPYALRAALLHQQIHFWQHENGEPPEDGYHDRQFRRKADELGIPCERGEHCTVLAYGGPFVELMVELGEAVVSGAAERVKKQRNHTWEYACACGSFRTNQEIDGTCNRCLQAYAGGMLRPGRKRSSTSRSG